MFVYWQCLPKPLFNDPLSVVLTDRSAHLLGARIASDGQWRFPSPDSIPFKFEKALLEFEDRRFYRHFGIDPVGLARAVRQNIKAKRIVSGGSTLSMQVMRLARKSKKRNLWNKAVEMVQATRLELTYSKAAILNHYVSNAPFGGNVVGLEAAAWRYFGKAPHLLSWAEAATLAVLPNAPSLIHPGRNRSALLAKRNRLLNRLQEQAYIDSLTLALAKEETLPEKPLPLPRVAPHLLDRVSLMTKTNNTARFKTTLDLNLQQRANEILYRHHQKLRSNGIHNAAAIIVAVETGAVLAYVGNVFGAGEDNQEQVDVIPAPRSTGSILKPFLYAAALDEGILIPESLIPDVPSMLSGYRPENFNRQFDGVVRAERAIVRSLNVPIVRILQNYGLEKFHFKLQQLGLSTINKPPSHYGLPLALGGAEASLEDLTSAYASMARVLNHFPAQSGQYNPLDFRQNHFLQVAQKKSPPLLQDQYTVFKAASIWDTFEAMRNVQRPSSEGEWQSFQSSRKIAWKTGTSFGFRDAWAIGLDRKYVVGVWVGNADGEGRPGLIGVKAAAPILFDLFKSLPSPESWFDPPYDEIIELPVCQQSGYRPTPFCEIDTVTVGFSAHNLASCPYHKRIYLDQSEQWQVYRGCSPSDEITAKTWFNLPPIEEYFYKSKHPNYKPLPDFYPACTDQQASEVMQLIYPKHYAKIYVPLDFNGERSRTIFKIAHRTPAQKVYWHLDRTFIGETSHFHEMALQPSAGKHLLTLVDEKGNRLERTFEVIGTARNSNSK